MEREETMSVDGFEAMRRAMVESQLRPNGVTDTRVLGAMGSVPREDFVTTETRAVAYADMPLRMGDGRMLNMPMVTGQMFDAARIGPDDAVLVLGDSAGYATAIARLLSSKVEAEALGAAEAAGPFDVIVIDGAVEAVESDLTDRLATGGRLVTGVFERGVTRLAIGHKSPRGFGLTLLNDAEILVLPEGVKPRAFAF